MTVSVLQLFSNRHRRLFFKRQQIRRILPAGSDRRPLARQKLSDRHSKACIAEPVRRRGKEFMGFTYRQSKEWLE